MGVVVAGQFENHVAEPEERLATHRSAGLEGSGSAVLETCVEKFRRGPVHVGTHRDEVVEPDDAVGVGRFGPIRVDRIRRANERHAVDLRFQPIHLRPDDAAAVVRAGKRDLCVAHSGGGSDDVESGGFPARRVVTDDEGPELEGVAAHRGMVPRGGRRRHCGWVGSLPVSRDIKRFTDLFDMAEHGPDVWVGGNARYPWGRVYGGQVAAQGLWAAAQTVPDGFDPHSLHAYFIRGGDSDQPIRFEVDRIRDGRSFITRRVVARQSSGAILNLSASFHKHEDAPDVTSIALSSSIDPPEDLPSASWSRLLDRRPIPHEQNVARAWVRVPDVGDDPLMHVLGHTFASDDVATDAVEIVHPIGRPKHDGEFSEYEHPYSGASLDHTVWFHRPARADEWCLHDFRSSGVYGARGISFGEIWSRDGVHVASVAQEVLLREATPRD